VRHAAVAPLRVEKVLDLPERAVGVMVREADRDERGIPAPLVRVQARSRFGPAADVIARENGKSLVA
jgi:hypothetical protein